MGNCCGLCGGKENDRSSRNAFQGQGRTLGEPSPHHTSNTTHSDKKIDGAAETVVDANLNDEERRQLRDDRAKAAEARLKKQGGSVKKKKTVTGQGQPLTGPNSKPLMQWTAG
mmetsp:Transcript_53297/g.64248  ORF Transcript_53297/g.64248 Transcript_53297/m.64248 type:complete len:113 (+) Transcript_53297:128-466(+)|eukprot:CAMPEP_0172510582 /NCGR_PEP_ID=MMETSP1066-20121228/229653_1 /TAXON_ID=671091 /ORGANISM="Coscinodiscus wailesii, Strain CCMP2513" /LENGTH=112 /DNA_ID=CAMNT_0013289603 /DNA_START=105 /DNA_END=443 /DNA_ORIENTATION=+